MSNTDRRDRRAIQVALSLFLLYMAVRLALPDPMIENTPSMSAMKFQPEWLWAAEYAFGFTVGVFGAWTSCRRCEFVATAMLMSAHISVSWFFAEGGATILPAALLIFVGLCGWVWVRSWKEVR